MLGELLSLSAALCWAIGASMYKVSLERVNPIGLNFVRSIPATALLFLITVSMGKADAFAMLDERITVYVLGASLIAWAIGDSLYFAGLKFIGVSRTVPLSYSYPLFILPLSLWLLHEPLTYNTLIGSLAIILSIWLISRSFDHGSDAARSDKYWLGVISALLAAICWAIGVVAFKYIMLFLDPIFLAFLRLLIIIPILGLLTMTTRIRKTIFRLSRRELALALIGGTIALGLGDLIYLIGLDLTQANIAGALAATTPIFSGVIAIIVLGEKVNLKVVLGIILVTLGAGLLMG